MCSVTVADAAGPVAIENVHIGFNGLFKVGCWTRLQFDIVGSAGSVVHPVIVVPDPDGNLVETPVGDVTLPDTGRHSVSQMIRLGRIGAAIRIENRTGNRSVRLKSVATVGTTPDANGNPIRAVQQHHQIWLIHGDQPAFDHALTRWERDTKGTLNLVKVADFSLFDTDPGEGLNAVVMSGDARVTAPQSRILSRWVQRGGRFVISVGGAVSQLQRNPVADWLPFLPSGQGSARNLVPLRLLVPKSSSLKVIADLPAGQFEEGSGKFLAGSLVVRDSFGMGHVTMLAVPLNLEPLLSWDGESQAELATKLLDIHAPWDDSNVGDQGMQSELNPTGVSDFQTQLANQIDAFSDIKPASNWSILGMLVLLILIVGPLDYILVHYLLKRPHFTWVTLPVLAIGFGLILLQWNKAGRVDEFTSQQLEVLDVDVEQGLIRSRSWMSMYSPQTRRYEIQFESAGEELSGSGNFSISPRLGWIERPESGYRGMYHEGSIGTNRPRYEMVNEGAEIEGFPILAYSSAAVECEWEREGVDLHSLVDSDLAVTRGHRLHGSFAHHFPGIFEDWFIAYDGLAYASVGRSPLAPGVEFDAGTTRSTNLTYELAGGQIAAQYYDPLSTDQAEMVRTMSFHQLMGGSRYSRLHHAALGGLDCSRLTELEHAVLWGKLKSAPLTALNVDGAPPANLKSETYVRILIPLKRTDANPDVSSPTDPLQTE
ncbi:MAG: hypothetical protein KDA69_11685 [Planctomycetaceae bacterium]|nr:hypothetical protein [Planctomycetaceae bacterium]